MEKLTEQFIEYKRLNQGRSVRTEEIYRLALRRLALYLDGKSPLNVTQDDLLAFSGPWLHKQGINPANRRLHVTAIRSFYKWLVASRQIRNDPAASVPMPKAAQRTRRVMTLANMERLMWTPNFETFVGIRDAAMIALLAGCGLRVSGLINLNDSNIVQDEIDGKLRLVLRVMEKGDKERRIPIPLEADMLLRMYLEHPTLKEIPRTLPNGDKVLFVSNKNPIVPAHDFYGEKRRFNRRTVEVMIKKYGKRAGIPIDQLHPHALRHLYGTEMAEDDVDLLVRQRLMGHADPKSTSIYTGLAMRKLTRESDRANPLTKVRTPVSELLKTLNKPTSK